MRKVTTLASLLLIFTIPWEDSVAIGSFGSLTRIIGLIVAGLWLFTLIYYHRIRLPHLYHGALYLFIIWNILSYLWSLQHDWTLERIKTYAQIFLLVYILWDLYETQRHLSLALQTYILGGYVAAIATIVNFINQQEAYLYSGGRYSLEGANAVDLAVILSLGLPVAWHLAFERESKPFIRIINFAYIPLATYSILLTGSRTSFFTLLPTLFYILWSIRKGNANSCFATFLTLSVSIGIGVTFVPATTFARLSTISSSISSGDLGLRMGLWLASLQVFVKHPILGVGSGSLRLIIGGVAHNGFLSVLAELGLVGLGLFCAVLIIVLYQIFTQQNQMKSLWIAVFAIWFFGISGLSWEFRKPTWLFLSLIIVGAGIISKGKEAPTIDADF